MKDNEIIKSLEKIYSVSEDPHSIYTPLDLCDEMISSITKLEGDILVISNLEFLITLKRKGIDMNTVHYTVNCDYKKRVAVQLGLDLNNIYQLDYNSKEIDLGIDMKFDVIVMNPPYNPNSLWKKFVLKSIDQLKDDGKMVVIHPDSWRRKSSHKKMFHNFKKHISKLHIKEFNAFPGIGISTDWYIYNKQKQTAINIYYENGDTECVDNNIDKIYTFSQKSIPANIIKKITTSKENGLINLSANSYGTEYTVYVPNGKYKQCGGIKRGTSWTKGDFHLTSEPTKYQFDNKIVMCYTRKLRATFFKNSDEVGCNRGYILLTDNINANINSVCLLYNSKMLWKLMIAIETENNLNHHPVWLLKTLNFENLTAQTEEELYEHYGLTEKEIEWIESE